MSKEVATRYNIPESILKGRPAPEGTESFIDYIDTDMVLLTSPDSAQADLKQMTGYVMEDLSDTAKSF